MLLAPLKITIKLLIFASFLATNIGLFSTPALAGESSKPKKKIDADRVLVSNFEKEKLALIPFNGNPPTFSRSTDAAHSGTFGLKLKYKNSTDPKKAYGNLKRPLALSGDETHISLWINKIKAAEKASLYLWLFESDGDCWLSPKIKLAELKTGWQEIKFELKKFTFQPRGPGTKEINTTHSLLIGSNFGDFTIHLDDLYVEGPDLVMKRKHALTERTHAHITLNDKQIVCRNFLGFGAEWDSRAYLSYGVTDQEFETYVASRMRWMKIPIVRVMMQTKWCYRDGKPYEWDSPEMKTLYRHLDFCQKENISVMLTDWGCEPKWLKAPGIKTVDDPKYATAIGIYMNHLIKTKGYSCIKYFVMVNEPNFEVKQFPRWLKGIRNVAAAFARHGLKDKIIFAGSDESNNENWHRQAVDKAADILGAYDIHRYAKDKIVRQGKLESFFKKQWDYARAKDKHANKKPMMVGEAGMRDHAKPPQGNDKIDSYTYGLWMADYGVQAARAGSSSILAWMLDDNSHKGFFWGLWTNKEKGFKLRPWFFTWSLLTRYIPRNAIIQRPRQATQHFRILAAKASDANTWTFVLVNRGTEAMPTSIHIPKEAEGAFKVYRYSKAKLLVDKNGFPIPEKTVTVSKGILKVSCGGESVVIVTSMK